MGFVFVFIFMVMAIPVLAIDLPVTAEKIKLFLEENKDSSIEDLLDALPVEFRKNYVLMHSSRSTQGASGQKPRVILFDSTSKLQLSFTEAPNRGANHLEIFQYDPVEKKYNTTDIDYSSGKPVVEDNPVKCKACHEDEVRPNWQNYPHWEGTFGTHERNYRNYRDKGETQYLQEFLQTSYKKGIYAKIGDIPGVNPEDLIPPKVPGVKKKALPKQNIPDEILEKFYDFQVVQNLQLTHDITLSNMERVVRILKENHPEFLPVFLATINACILSPEALQLFLPKQMRVEEFFDKRSSPVRPLEKGDAFESVLISILNKNGIKMEKLLTNYNTDSKLGSKLNFGDGAPNSERNHSSQYGFTHPFVKANTVLTGHLLDLDEFSEIRTAFKVETKEIETMNLGTVRVPNSASMKDGNEQPQLCQFLAKMSQEKFKFSPEQEKLEEEEALECARQERMENIMGGTVLGLYLLILAITTFY